MATKLKTSKSASNRKRSYGKTLFSFGIVELDKRAKNACPVDENEEEGDVALNQALQVSAQEAQQKQSENGAFLERLYTNLKALHFVLRCDVPPDGNCFYHSVIDQLKRLGMTTSDAAQLRRDLVLFLRNLDDSDPLAPHINIKFLLSHAKDGVWANHIIVQAMARMLERDIWIVTSQKSKTDAGQLMTKIDSGYLGDPILVGHIGEYHYCSLDNKMHQDITPPGTPSPVQVQDHTPPGSPLPVLDITPPGSPLRVQDIPVTPPGSLPPVQESIDPESNIAPAAINIICDDTAYDYSQPSEPKQPSAAPWASALFNRPTQPTNKPVSTDQECSQKRPNNSICSEMPVTEAKAVQKCAEESRDNEESDGEILDSGNTIADYDMTLSSASELSDLVWLNTCETKMSSMADTDEDGYHNPVRSARSWQEWQTWYKNIWSTKIDFTTPAHQRRRRKTRKGKSKYTQLNNSFRELRDEGTTIRKCKSKRKVEHVDAKPQKRNNENQEVTVYIIDKISKTRTKSFLVRQDISVLDLKKKIAVKLRRSHYDIQELKTQKEKLKMCDWLSLSDYGICDQSIIEMEIAPGLLEGGKGDDNQPPERHPQVLDLKKKIATKLGISPGIQELKTQKEKVLMCNLLPLFDHGMCYQSTIALVWIAPGLLGGGNEDDKEPPTRHPQDKISLCQASGCTEEGFVACHRCSGFLCQKHTDEDSPCSDHKDPKDKPRGSLQPNPQTARRKLHEEEEKSQQKDKISLCQASGCTEEGFVACHRCSGFLCQKHTDEDSPCSDHKKPKATRTNDVSNFIKCRNAQEELMKAAVPCIENSFTEWYSKIKPIAGLCKNPKRCSTIAGKPREIKGSGHGGSCASCLAWVQAIQNAVSNHNAGEIQWTNVTPGNFASDPLEVAKAFVFKTPKDKLKYITRFNQLDAGSLLLIMKTFEPFLVANSKKIEQVPTVQNISISDDEDDDDDSVTFEYSGEESEVDALIRKIEEVYPNPDDGAINAVQDHIGVINKNFELRCSFAHMSVELGLYINQRTLDKNFEDIRHLVRILEDMEYLEKPEAESIRTRLNEIQWKPVTQTMLEELKDYLPQGLKDKFDNLMQCVNTIKDDLKKVQRDIKNDPADTHQSGHSGHDFDLEVCRKELVTVYKNEMSRVRLLPWCDDTRDMHDIYVTLALEEQTYSGATLLEKNEDLVSLEISKGNPASRVLVKGLAGSGKSTLMCKLAYDWSKHQSDSPLVKYDLVFLLSLCAVQRSSSLIDCIFEQLLADDTEVLKNDLKSFIKSNPQKVLILLDGFDEYKALFDSDDERAGEREIDKIISSKLLRDCRVVLSTRPYEYLGKHQSNYVTVNLQGFSPTNVKLYISKFFDSNISIGKGLIKRLEESEMLKSIATIPVILMLICLLWEDDQTLPLTQSELYEKFVQYLWKKYCIRYENQDGSDESPITNEYNDFVHRIGKVALDGLVFPGEEQREKLIFSETDFDQGVFQLGCLTGLLTRERFRSKLNMHSKVTFMHKSLQEFCAARYWASLNVKEIEHFGTILEKIRTWDECLQRFELIKFCCGIVGKTSKAGVSFFIRQLINIYLKHTDIDQIKIGRSFQNDDKARNMTPILILLCESQINISQDQSLVQQLKGLFSVGSLVVSGRDSHILFIYHKFVESVSELQILKEIIVFESNNVPPDSLNVMSDSLLCMPDVKSVYMAFSFESGYDKPMQKVDMNQFVDILGMLPKLHEITIIKLQPRTDGGTTHFDINPLLDCLSESQHIQKYTLISFIDVMFAANSMKRFLCKLKNVSSLSLHYTLNNEHIVLNCDDFGHILTPYLEVLELIYNHSIPMCMLLDMGYHDMTVSSTVSSLCKHLHKASNLRELDLSHTNICDDGIGVLVRELKHCTKLSKLALSDTGIRSTGIIKLACRFSLLPNLTNLDISGNLCTTRALHAVFKHIHHLTKLTAICIQAKIDGQQCSTLVTDCLAAVNMTNYFTSLDTNKIQAIQQVARGHKRSNHLDELANDEIAKVQHNMSESEC